MVEKEILIQEASIDDLEDIFYLYMNYMFDSYLLRFGSPFVKKYLKIIIESPNCGTFIAVENSIVGFIMVTFNTKRLLFELFFNIEVLYIWVKEVLARPSLAFESLKSVLYPFNTNLENVNAEFLFIAIEPAQRNRHLACGLIEEALSLMRQKGNRKVKVSTVVKNEAVNALLEKLGFKVERTFGLFKKFMYLYSYDLCRNEDS